MKPPSTHSTDAAPQHTKPRSWIWFFIVVSLLCATAITILIVYNLSQLLTLKEAEAGLAKWRENGPNNYVMYFEVRRNGGTAEPAELTEPGEYLVRVEQEEVKFVSRDGVALPPKTYQYFSMESIYEDLILQNLHEDKKEGAPSTFTRGIFHHKDGHVQWYVRRISGTRNRVELIMKDFQSRDKAK